MTTEAVELTCRTLVQIPCPHEQREPGFACATLHQRPCAKPIRQRTSGPCRCGHSREAHEGHTVPLPIVHPTPRHCSQGDSCFDYDPGYDHVDLEGACQKIANDREENGICGHGPEFHYGQDSSNPSCDGCANDGRGGNFDSFVPPVLSLPHEATV